jgi:hypothetical protein
MIMNKRDKKRLESLLARAAGLMNDAADNLHEIITHVDNDEHEGAHQAARVVIRRLEMIISALDKRFPEETPDV